MTNSPPISVRSNERRIILASAIITILFGAGYVFIRWAMRHQLTDGTLRCVTLTCFMVAVHAWGWSLYRLQNKSSVTQSLSNFLRHANLNWQVLKKVTPFPAMCLPMFTLLIACPMLDGGDSFKLVGGALVTYWITVLVCCFVRARPLTRIDLFLIKFGFWMLLVPIGFALHTVWNMKGVGY